MRTIISGAVILFIVVVGLAVTPNVRESVDDWNRHQREQRAFELAQERYQFEQQQAWNAATFPGKLAQDYLLRFLLLGTAAGAVVLVGDAYLRRQQRTTEDRRLVAPDARGLLPVSRHQLESSELLPLIERAVEAYHVARIEDARNPGTPAHLHYSPSITTAAAASPVPPPAVAAATAVPGVCDLADVLDTFQPSPDRLLLGIGPEGPITVPVAKLFHVALSGTTGGGKSNLMRLLLPQLQAIGAQVVLADPHYAELDPDSGEDWRPIARRLRLAPAVDADAIASLFNWLVEEMEHRLELRGRGQPFGRPLFLAYDELPVIRESVNGADDVLARFLREGRKVKIFSIGASQDFLIKTIGGSSGARDCYRTAFYVGGDRIGASALLDMPQREIDDGKLSTGLALVRSIATTPPQLVRIPLASNRAIYRLLQAEDGTGDHASDMPDVCQNHANVSSQNQASGSGKQLTPEEQRVIELFLGGNDTSGIVQELYGLKSSAGRPYQTKLAEVQALLRTVMKRNIS